MGKSREYKQISSKSFHGELRLVKNSVNSVLLELNRSISNLAFLMGLSCHRLAAFPYAVQRLSTSRKLHLTAIRARGVAVGVGGIVAVAICVGVCVDVRVLMEIVNFD